MGQAVRYTAHPMMILYMGTTRVSLVQEERSVCMAGMALVAKCIVCLEMTLWRVTLAIRKDKRFVCKIGSEKFTAICIVSQPMIHPQVIRVTQLGKGCV